MERNWKLLCYRDISRGYILLEKMAPALPTAIVVGAICILQPSSLSSVSGFEASFQMRVCESNGALTCSSTSRIPANASKMLLIPNVMRRRQRLVVQEGFHILIS